MALFWASLLCSAGRRASALSLYRSSGAAATLLTLTIAVIVGYAWLRGIPGSVLNFGTYAAMPLWETAMLPQSMGLACLFLCLLAGARLDASAMQSLVFSAVVAVCFVPWGLAACIGLMGMAGIFADVLFFWIKGILLLRIGVRSFGFLRPIMLWPLWCLGAALLLGPELIRIGAG